MHSALCVYIYESPVSGFPCFLSSIVSILYFKTLMDTYSALSAFLGSLTAIVLAEALLHLRVVRLLLRAVAHIIAGTDVHHQARDIASSIRGSDASVLSTTQSAMLRGITGPLSGKRHTVLHRSTADIQLVASTPSCTLSEKLDRLGT